LPALFSSGNQRLGKTGRRMRKRGKKEEGNLSSRPSHGLILTKESGVHKKNGRAVSALPMH